MDIMDQILSDAQAADHETRYHEIVKQWEVVPQGDCNLHAIGSLDSRGELEARIRKHWPDFRIGELGEITDDLQLVPGSTLGSRHCIRESDREFVTVYRPGRGASPLVGPTIVAAARISIDHPEHADHSIPAGTYQVVYQRDHAAEMARLAD